MTLVIDASVALKWFVEEEGSDRASGLLASSELLIAPDLLIAEVCNASWRAVRGGGMLAAQQDDAARRIGFAFDELVPNAQLAPRAVALSRALDHPAYDCFYLALSELRDAILITADARLIRRITGTPWAALVRNLAEGPA